jgi:SPP1 gp7 family putative phage head morphogenesis protein
MSTQDNLTNAFIRHQVFLQRFGSGLGKKSMDRLADFELAAEKRLLDESLTDFQRDRLTVIARDLELQFKADLYEEFESNYRELKDFAEYEAEFSHGLLETNISGSTTLPSPEQISAAIDFAKMDVTNSGLGIRQIFTGFTDRAAKQVAREITEGAVLGETNKQIADRLQRLNGLHKNQAMTLARTVTNNVSSIARDEVMRANDDVLDGYEWVAALDNRTTLICGSRDGQVYKFSDPDAPRPPAHFNCRSTIVPKVKPEFDLGADVKTTRPSIGDDGAELIGSDTNYEKWLRKQPAKFQDEILGKERGKLFRNKGIKLDRFIDANGNPIPLDQLKVLDESFNIKAKTKKITETIVTPEPDLPLFNGIQIDETVDLVKTEKILRERMTPVMLQAVRRADKPSLISRMKSGVYYPSTKELYASRIDKKHAVFAHEYGHHLDFEINKKGNIGIGDQKLTPISTIDQKFRDAMNLDKRNLFGSSLSRFDKFMTEYKEAYWEKYKKRANSRYSYLRPKNHEINDNEGYLTDIFDALSKGESYSKYKLFGHGKSYFSEEKNQTTEIFANLFALATDESDVGQRARQYFPNLFKRFDELLIEYNNGDFD